ncbi:MAG: PAS domain S-box protein [Syntrophales bacterium]
MDDKFKTKKQLATELAALRQRLTEAENADAERERAEHELRESKERYQTVLENIEDGYYEVDLAGKFTFLNEWVVKNIGYSREEMLGRSYKQFTDKENATTVSQVFNEVYTSGKSDKRTDWIIITKDGTRKVVEASVSLIRDAEARPTGFQGIVRDITERKRAEEALRKSEERYRSLLDNASDAILLANPEGQLLEVNRKAEELLGYSREKLLGMDISRLHPKEELEKVVRVFKDIVQNGSGSVSDTYALRRDGTAVPIDVTGSCFEFDGEKVAQGIFRDITGRRKTEEELKKGKLLLESVFNSTHDLIIVLDRDLRILMSNWKSPLYTDCKEFPVNTHCYEAFMHRDAACESCQVLQVLTTGKPASGERYNPHTKRINEVNAYPIFGDNNEIIMVAEHVRDISERKRMEEALRENLSKQERELRISTALYEVSSNMLQERSLNENLQLIADKTAEVFDTDTSYIALADDKKDKVRMHTLFGIRTKDFKEMEIPFGVGVGGYIMQSRKGVIIDDYFNNELIKPSAKISQIVKNEGVVSGMGVPIQSETEDHGVLYVFHRQMRKFTKSELNALEMFGHLTALEITGRQTRNALHESNKMYKTLTESSLAAVFIVQDGKFRFINTSAVAYMGYTAEELIGQKSDVIIHPDDREMVKKMATEMLSGVRKEAFEYRIVTKQNQVAWILQIVTPIEYEGRQAVLANAIDVTDLRESRKKLEEMMAMESSILSSIPDAVFGLQDERILFVNDAVEVIFGWRPEELLGKNVNILCNSESEFENLSKRIYRDHGNQATCRREFEIPCRHKDGSNIFCKVTYCAIENSLSDNKVVATYEDITDKKKASFQLLQSEKMASIGQLAAGVAHEINNPTAFVSSNLKTLSDYMNDVIKLIGEYRTLAGDLKKEATGEESQKMVAERLKLIEDLETKIDVDFIIKDAVDLIGESREGTGRIGRIVQDLKNFAHPGDEKLRTVNINNSIESTLNIVWNELKYKAVVHKEYGDVPDTLCYPQQLNQVFMNILVNAAQAIKEKGEISIVTKAVDGHAEIKFADTGVGIPKENLPKIFDPFFTTKDVGKGTGLGLHVAYNIIEKHNGTIEVDSTVNKGTTFTVKIPIHCE